MKETTPHSFIYLITILDNQMCQSGMFSLYSSFDIFFISEKLASSPRVKKALGKRWTIHINKTTGGPLRQDSNSTLVRTIMKIIEYLNERNNVCDTIIILPENNISKEKNASDRTIRISER